MKVRNKIIDETSPIIVSIQISSSNLFYPEFAKKIYYSSVDRQSEVNTKVSSSILKMFDRFTNKCYLNFLKSACTN